MVPTLAPVRIMGADPIMDIRDRLRWQLVIALITLVVPGIGRAIGITSGSLDIGFIGTGRKSGDAATTSYADIDRTTKERRWHGGSGDALH